MFRSKSRNRRSVLSQLSSDTTKPKKKSKQERHCLTWTNVILSALIPLMIDVFTVVTYLQQQEISDRNRKQDQLIANATREKDLHIANLTRLQDEQVADEQRQQQVYDQLIDNIYNLQKDGMLQEMHRGRAFVNARYRAAHQQLDSKRRSQSLEFLKEKQLIGQDCDRNNKSADIIRLNKLNFDNLLLISSTDELYTTDMTCVKFNQVSLVNARFSYVDFTNASFDGSRLRNVQFQHCILIGVSFHSTELNGSNFTDSDFYGAHFVDVDLSNTLVTVDQMQQTGANENVILPKKVVNAMKNKINISEMICGWNQTGVTIAGNGTGAPGSDLRSLNVPMGIFVDYNDNDILYVADSVNTRVLKFEPGNMAGKVVARELGSPLSVFVDSSKTLYVGDMLKVSKFDYYNPNVSVIVAGTDEFGQELNEIGDIILSVQIIDDHSIYISDTSNHRIVKWKTNAKSGVLVVGVSGEQGKDSVHLYEPAGIFLDSIHRSLYVADQKNHRIQRFRPVGNKTGETVAGNGIEGNDLTNLNHPKAVIVDTNEMIYIADTQNFRIVKWNAKNYAAGGKCIAGCSGLLGSQAEWLYLPVDFKFDSIGNLIVSDLLHRIRKFQPIQNRRC